MLQIDCSHTTFFSGCVYYIIRPHTESNFLCECVLQKFHLWDDGANEKNRVYMYANETHPWHLSNVYLYILFAFINGPCMLLLLVHVSCQLERDWSLIELLLSTRPQSLTQHFAFFCFCYTLCNGLKVLLIHCVSPKTCMQPHK